MMLYLIIQSSDIIGEPFIFRCEVGGSSHLVYSPFVGNVAFFIRHRKLNSFHYMRQLKNYCQCKASDHMHGHKADQHLPPGDVEKQQWQPQHVKQIDQFSQQDHYKMDHSRWAILSVIIRFAKSLEVHEILQHYPKEGLQRVKGKNVK